MEYHQITNDRGACAPVFKLLTLYNWHTNLDIIDFFILNHYNKYVTESIMNTLVKSVSRQIVGSITR